MICVTCGKREACSLFVGTYAGWCGWCVRNYHRPPTLEETERLVRIMDECGAKAGFRRPKASVRMRALRYMFESQLYEVADAEDPAPD